MITKRYFHSAQTYGCANTLEDVHVGLGVFLVGLVHDGEEDEVVVDFAAVILEDGGGLLDVLYGESLQLLLQQGKRKTRSEHVALYTDTSHLGLG